MKSLKEFINNAVSTRSVGVFILIFTSIVVTLILSSRYYLHDNIIENSVSKRDIIASKTIEIVDTEKTQKLKEEIAKKISPILLPIQDDFIKTNLDKNVDKIENVRDSHIANELKIKELTDYFNIADDNEYELGQMKYMLNISQLHFDKLELASRNILNDILSEGISEANIQDDLSNIIRKHTVKRLYGNDYDAVEYLIKSVIAPNLVVDELATEVSKKNALNSVKPVVVTFKAGSKVVSADQPVSKVQKDALKQLGYNVIQLNLSGILGIFLLVFLTLFTCAYYIEKYENTLRKKQYYALISTMMIFISLIAATIPSHLAFIPILTFTIIMGVFLNNKIAAISTIMISIAMMIALQGEMNYLALIILGTFAAAFALNSIDYTNRMDLIRVGAVTSSVYALCVIGMFFLEYNLNHLTASALGYYLLVVILNGILSSILSVGLLPIIEAIFKISTPYGLMELANSNNSLLLKLQEKAPGTHHHSQMVAIVAEAAAEAIGANHILTRIGALYHDVGKLNRPLFFFENQSYYGIENPHEQFSPKFSKMVITTHPNEGVNIAKEYKISPAIYPFILEHHGDSIASYFYNEAIKQEGVENVSEADYRYNAPRPSTKESAIVMLADSVESAVRSLKNPTFEDIEAKISAVIKGKIADNQLSDSPLTMKDIKTITAVFNRVIKGMHHQRIQYHEDMKDINEKILKSGEKFDEN